MGTRGADPLAAGVQQTVPLALRAGMSRCRSPAGKRSYLVSFPPEERSGITSVGPMDYTDLPFTDAPQGSEGEVLLFALERVHRQFGWKTGGLTAEQLCRTHPPSSMTLAGLIKHLAFVEDGWTAKALGRPIGPPWDMRDWVGNDGWGWESAVTDEPEDLYNLWYGTVARSHAAWSQMIIDGGLDAEPPQEGGYIVNRRRLLVDLLEENLLHTGHASLLREAIDGLRGNDPW